MLNLKDRIHHLPNELSGGQQQRVSIGRALFNAPSILLADEPTASLDHDNAIHVMDALFEAAENLKATLIVVTHDSSMLNRFRRVLTLEDGTVRGA